MAQDFFTEYLPLLFAVADSMEGMEGKSVGASHLRKLGQVITLMDGVRAAGEDLDELTEQQVGGPRWMWKFAKIGIMAILADDNQFVLDELLGMDGIPTEEALDRTIEGLRFLSQIGPVADELDI